MQNQVQKLMQKNLSTAFCLFWLIGHNIGHCNYSLTRSFKIPAMGTLWVFSDSTSKLKKDFRTDLILAQSFFSEWDTKSELSSLKSEVLCPKMTKVSPPLFEAFLAADNLFKTSSGLFNPTLTDKPGTISANQDAWRGLVFDSSNSQVCFSEKIHALSFSGFIKGFLLGKFSKLAIANKISKFRIQAGGGDEVLFENDLWTTRSFSRSTQRGKRHIFDPRKKDKKLKDVGAGVECISTPTEVAEWPNIGALADGFATVLTFEDEIKLPKNCKILYRDEKPKESNKESTDTSST